LEKALKAYLAEITEEMPPKKHDLMALVKKAGLISNTTEEQRDFLRRLSIYYIETRYPFLVLTQPAVPIRTVTVSEDGILAQLSGVSCTSLRQENSSLIFTCYMTYLKMENGIGKDSESNEVEAILCSWCVSEFRNGLYLIMVKQEPTA
jgi:hypothetical protein